MPVPVPVPVPVRLPVHLCTCAPVCCVLCRASKPRAVVIDWGCALFVPTEEWAVEVPLRALAHFGHEGNQVSKAPELRIELVAALREVRVVVFTRLGL